MSRRARVQRGDRCGFAGTGSGVAIGACASCGFVLFEAGPGLGSATPLGSTAGAFGTPVVGPAVRGDNGCCCCAAAISAPQL